MTSDTPKRGPGRPKRSAPEIRPRTAGRIGATWDQAVEIAKTLGITMTTYVEEALKRENARQQRRLIRTQEQERPPLH